MAGGRGVKSRPAYVAVLVCMATKAIHLEPVTDYTTAAFLAAFSRFCSRRGVPGCMYSDRGTNFQGASRELTQAFNAIRSDERLHSRFALDQIRWSFIPAAAPHWGGLWEAGVHSVKFHLKRVLAGRTPTFEELCTLLCRIEACLNSRPPQPLSDSPESLDVLTPAYFLIGGSLPAIPELSVLDVNTTRLSRWQQIQQMAEQFWTRWADDYVRSLQHRGKWQSREAPVCEGQMVLVRHDNLPPTKWPLGRVIKCFPGPDGLVRVVKVRTATSELDRPIVKLAPLPVRFELNSDHAPSTALLPSFNLV